MANLARAVGNPIHLLSWAKIAQISSMLAADEGHWVMFREDRKAAYRQIPIDPADQNTDIIALKRPVVSRWYGFVTSALIFGSVADVLHYNFLSRLLVTMVNRYIGIPLFGYFADFSGIIRKTLGQSDWGAFTPFCSLLGFQLKDEKSAVGPSIAFLGRVGQFPCADNERELSITTPEEKRSKWSSWLSTYIRDVGGNFSPLYGDDGGPFISPTDRSFW